MWNRRRPKSRWIKHRLLIQGNKMSKLSFFIVLAGLLLFPGPTPAAETDPIAALCARPGLQALREAQEEMTIRDTAAATGIKVKHPAPFAERDAQGREDVRRVGGNTAHLRRRRRAVRIINGNITYEGGSAANGQGRVSPNGIVTVAGDACNRRNIADEIEVEFFV